MPKAIFTLCAELLSMQDSELSNADINYPNFQNDWEAIAACELFHEVEEDLLRSLLEKCEIRTFSKGEHITEPGQENHNLYILLSGTLMVYLVKSDHTALNPDMGFQIPLGECIGEMSIIENKPVSAYVIPADECRLLVIPGALFWDELLKWPAVVKSLLTGLSSRMRRLDQVAIKTLEERLRFEQIERDLKAAAQIQSNILPQENPLLSQYPQIDVAASIEPARSVGGDFFDAFAIDDKTVGLAIGDVSGKGIPAALFMIRAVTILRTNLGKLHWNNQSLATIFAAVNRQLCESNPNCLFVTIFLGTLDITTGKLTYVHGGHNRPFLKRPHQPSHLIEIPEGMLLGIHDVAEYQMAELQLNAGDLFVMYTDGVTEARNVEGEFFMEDRVSHILDTLPQAIAAKGIVQTLGDRVKEFAQDLPQADDITIMALRYFGKG